METISVVVSRETALKCFDDVQNAIEAAYASSELPEPYMLEIEDALANALNGDK